MRALRDEEEVIETFAGSLMLMPKTGKRRMKIRAFFVQNVVKNGAFSISPALSFHAIVRSDSNVFKCVENDDLEGLVGLLEKRSASLTDYDPEGRSLLVVSFDAVG